MTIEQLGRLERSRSKRVATAARFNSRLTNDHRVWRNAGWTIEAVHKLETAGIDLTDEPVECGSFEAIVLCSVIGMRPKRAAAQL